MRTAIIWLLLCASAQAGGWYVAGNGYYANGDGWFYTRTCAPGYWYCGRWYAGACSYTKVYQQAAKIAYSANWKSDMIKATERLRDTELFVQAMSQSGLARPSAYASAVASTNYQQGSYAQQGATIFGVKSYAPNIGQVDVSASLHMLGRLAEQLHGGTAEAVYGLNSITGQVITGQTEIAKIQEAGRVAVALAAVASPPKSVTTNYQTQAGTTAQAHVATSSPNAMALVGVQNLIDNACVKCHKPDSPKGNLSLHDFATWTPDKLAHYGPEIAARTTSRDPKYQMPPPDSGVRPLSPVELRALLSVLPEEENNNASIPTTPPPVPRPDPELVEPGRGAEDSSAGQGRR